jgi:hypothetical protein
MKPAELEKVAMRDLSFINIPEELLRPTNSFAHIGSVSIKGRVQRNVLRCVGVEDLAARQRSFVTDSSWSSPGAQLVGVAAT